MKSAPVTDALRRQLVAICSAAGVLSSDEARARYARDETPNLPPAIPDLVVRPADKAQVAEVLRRCAAAGVFVTPRGAGTGQSGGCVPAFGGVVMSLEALDAIVAIDRENLTAKVQPGVVLGALHAAVEDEGLFYPPDPASLAWCTLGGNVAENAGGPRALRYGVTRDYVLGLEAVLSTGEVIRTGKQTVKGVAGYDLTALLCGSEGTLAVITEITVKLVPKPRAVETALCVFDRAGKAATAVAQILAAGVVPRTLEYMDRASIRAVAAHGAPYRFSDDAAAALIIETDGDDHEQALGALSRAVEGADAAGAKACLVATDERIRRDIWQSRRLLSEATRKIRARKISEDIVVPRSRIPAVIAQIGALGEAHGLLTCAFGHAGDGNLHVQILFDHDDELPAVRALLDDLFAMTLAEGGTITGEHGVGLAKKRWLPLEQGPRVIQLQRGIKDVFDPAGILNPGKVFDPAR